MNLIQKNIIVLLCMLLSAIPLFAQEFSLGAGAEVNLITLEEKSLALSGIINAEMRFGSVFAAGVNIGAGYGWNEFIGIENRIFGRWYYARPANLEFFFQADAGLLVTFRTGDPLESRGSPSVGLTLGTRINLPGRWYLEPHVRGGYPYLGGLGILMGYSPEPQKSSASRTNLKNSGGLNNENQVNTINSREELKSGEELMVFMQLGNVPSIAALAIEPYVYFASNIAGFSGLDLRIVENNYRLLREIANFLQLNPEYNLVIEGHANPVIKTKNEEDATLNPLSLKRAELVANTLINYGIDRKRLIIAGSGGAKTLVPWPEREYWKLNRRVEFMLVRPRSAGG